MFVNIDFFKEGNIAIFHLTDATQTQTSHDFVPITITITNSIPSSNDPPHSHKSSPLAWIALNHRTELHTLYQKKRIRTNHHERGLLMLANTSPHHLTLNMAASTSSVLLYIWRVYTRKRYAQPVCATKRAHIRAEKKTYSKSFRRVAARCTFDALKVFWRTKKNRT